MLRPRTATVLDCIDSETLGRDRSAHGRGWDVSASTGKSGRSAISGRYVKQSTVKSHPKTTVNETSKKKK